MIGRKLTVISLRYLIKQISKNFPCLDTLIQTLEMLLDFLKAKKTLKSRNIPRVWIY